MLLKIIFLSFLVLISCKKADLFHDAVQSNTIYIVGNPVFSLASGTYATAQSLTLTVEPSDATIRYTTDGSEPSTANGTIYSGAIDIFGPTAVIKAIGYKTDWKNSSVVTRNYIIDNGAVPPPAVETGAITFLVVHNSQLYCGTKNTTAGAEVYLFTSESNFVKVLDPAALGWNGTYEYINSMASIGGRIYVGVYNAVNGGEVWRTTNTSVTPYLWEKVYDQNPPFNSIGAIAEFGGSVVIGVSSFDTGGSNTDKVRILYSNSGNGPFTDITGPWGLYNNEVAYFTVYGGHLYIATIKQSNNFGDGCELYRYEGVPESGNWRALVDQAGGIRGGGFAAAGGANANNMGLTSFAEYGGYFYMGVKSVTVTTGLPNQGCKIWRSNDMLTEASYQPVVGDTAAVNGGFGSIQNVSVDTLIVFQGTLYALTRNSVTGTQLWGSTDGINWTQRNTSGFGDVNNTSGRAAIVFNNKLYIGLEKSGGGASLIYFSSAP